MDKEDIKRLEELLLMLITQNIEQNALLRKLNYISGADYSLTSEEIKRELEYLKSMVDCITRKGVVCPIRGLSRKVAKTLDKEEE